MFVGYSNFFIIISCVLTPHIAFRQFVSIIVQSVCGSWTVCIFPGLCINIIKNLVLFSHMCVNNFWMRISIGFSSFGQFLIRNCLFCRWSFFIYLFNFIWIRRLISGYFFGSKVLFFFVSRRFLFFSSIFVEFLF